MTRLALTAGSSSSRGEPLRVRSLKSKSQMDQPNATCPNPTQSGPVQVKGPNKIEPANHDFEFVPTGVTFAWHWRLAGRDR